jgi:serine/tyrosine/threonine adenylyltransferase
VITTGEPVFRETILPGSVLTRVAASHIRVGTFEYAATRGSDAVRGLADYVIQRHYPEISGAEHPYESLLQQIIRRQARLIAAWMQVGFVHGVMNTDNMAISGETIDFGPCAFMDRYDPETVFSSIDRNGRYAFRNQPGIALWNLARLAEALLPLFNPNEKIAVEIAQEILGRFATEYSEHWRKGMCSKLGLFESKSEDESLIEDLLTWMHRNEIDFTNGFRSLTMGESPRLSNGKTTESDPAWKNWHDRWEQRRSAEGRSTEETETLMRRSSPNLIPRNHHVEAVLGAAMEKGDRTPFQKFLTALQNPYEDRAEHLPYLEPGHLGGEKYTTFCGT